MIIGVDIDGVVRDIHTPTLRWWNLITGKNLTLEDIQGWNIAEYLGVPKTGHDVFYSYWFSQRNIFKYAKAIDMSRVGLSQLSGKFDVLLVTSQRGQAKIWTLEWIEQNVWEGTYSGIVFAHDKSLIKTDILIDDGPHNFDNYTGRAILFDQPWNRDEKRYERAKGWGEALDYVDVVR